MWHSAVNACGAAQGANAARCGVGTEKVASKKGGSLLVLRSDLVFKDLKTAEGPEDSGGRTFSWA